MYKYSVYEKEHKGPAAMLWSVLIWFSSLKGFYLNVNALRGYSNLLFIVTFQGLRTYHGNEYFIPRIEVRTHVRTYEMYHTEIIYDVINFIYLRTYVPYGALRWC